MRRHWPAACHHRLLELRETQPQLSYRELGAIITIMPEARAFGLIATKDAVCGKIWRMRRWSPETAAKLKRHSTPKYQAGET